MKHLLATTLLLLLLGSGCSIVSKEQCQHLNWYGRGYADALKGKPLSQANVYANACRNQGVYLETSAWRRGYQRHLQQLCPIDKAKTLAVSEPNYQGSCLTIPAFASAYQQERGKAAERAALQKIEDELAAIRQERAKLRGLSDEASRARSQELEWHEFQLQQTLIELKPPVAIEGDVLNPGLHR